MTAEPAAVPGAEIDRTLFAALHGELVPHGWRDPAEASEDAYSLFSKRSLAMGWLTEAREGAAKMSWWMNDADLGADSASRIPRVAWFQVRVSQPISSGLPLPTQAFLACIGDVMGRMGTLNLRAVQLLLPEGRPGGPAAGAPFGNIGALLQAADWFTDTDPRNETEVLVTMDSGQDPSIPAVAPGMVQWLQEFHQNICVFDSVSVTDDSESLLQPAIGDHFWPGPPQNRAVFRCVLAEWSLDIIGWLAAFLAEASVQHGVTTPVLLTVLTSSERSSSHAGCAAGAREPSRTTRAVEPRSSPE
ncbi:hypothetical protein EDD29_5367 [Actinocorallia herbida]|uniref:Uncharacterized protein n=1 Tax=Actinocorallia herbida TaxID=58109 RepID=A0A3N1D2J4_9ACTN|nr:hypothetical protein [Actinocorallia herbida]ROO87732.1 hypothetical protein EDD29_5367 [Actinocorallia herbida]